MKITKSKIFDWLAVLSIVAMVLTTWISDAGIPDEQAATLAGTETSAVRVEIQRYMGYETLLIRYLSLPYDLTMNTNEQVAILDTGFLLLIFVPIVVLLGLRRWPIWQWVVLLSCIFLMIVSTANGYISAKNLEMVGTDVQALDSYLAETAFADAPAGVISALLYQQFSMVYDVMEGLLERISGERDAVTYPLLLALFTLFFYCTFRRIQGRQPYEQGLLLLVFVYLFFWLLLSSGIVWYGFLVFPLLTALVFWAVPKQVAATELTGKTVLYGFYLLVGVSVLLGFTQRLSNIKLSIVKNDPLAGKRLYDPAYVKYQAGDKDAAGVIEEFYPGMSRAMQEINRETNSLIYNVGTRFNFFIRENDKRIFKDNQLDFFQVLQTKYPYKERIIALLKNSGFRYIMLDFNTPSLDKTPERALVDKFKKFLLLVYNNPAVELIATDRLIKESVNGQVQYKYGAFGEIENFGSYAVFRIK